VKAIKKGAQFDELDFGPMTETGIVRDSQRWGRSKLGYPLIILRDSKAFPGTPVFYTGRLSMLLEDEVCEKASISRLRVDEYFEWSLLRPWRLLGLLGDVTTWYTLRVSGTGMVVEPSAEERSRCRKLLMKLVRAVRMHWDVLESDTVAFDCELEGQRFSKSMTIIPGVLSVLGAPMEPNPLKAEGRLKELIDQFGANDE
jgi:hypothetical protein